MKTAKTSIIPCTCVSPYQDQKHGKNNRVHNELQGQKKRGHRCTVCGSLKA